ncbi:MAG: AmmeMemoRadiSam system protein A [Deltaproteobacteria bacterium]|nr:AmmeMemoRadiSam system protein A [Deltaproteobacteria bacterium]
MNRGDTLLRIARATIEHAFGGPAVEKPDGAPFLDEKRAVLVTLRKHGELRGCVGQLAPRMTLFEAVQDAARAAAFRDTRFTPLGEGELAALHIEISVLSVLQRLDVHGEQETVDALRVGVDGVVLSAGSRRAVFTPEMWKELPDPREFRWHLRRKGGLPLDRWPEDMSVQRFTAELYEEPAPAVA